MNSLKVFTKNTLFKQSNLSSFSKLSKLASISFKNFHFIQTSQTSNKINKNVYNLNKKSFTDLGQNNQPKYSESEALEIVEAGVFEILKGAAKCKLDKLSRAASFKDLGFDSLDQVEIIVAMEEQFNLNISGNLILFL